MPRTQMLGRKKTRPSLAAAAAQKKFMLRLYVAGTTPRSAQAILDAENLCEQHLGGRFKLEVIDIYQRPALARDEQIVAVPTLVRRLPEPLRKLVGDLSNAERVLIGLDLLVRDEPTRH
jgi:circadian clock protein KaiB